MKYKKIFLTSLYVTLALMVVAVMSFIVFKPILVLPRVGLGPGFGLIDLNGERITNETMRGRIVLYNFTYTNCNKPVCAKVMQKMQEVRKRTGEIEGLDLDKVGLELVTISIDPERDTPEVMAKYAAQFGVSPEGDEGQIPWHFLTGDDPMLTKIMVSTGFDLYYEKIDETSPDNYQYDFVPMVVLIDDWGIIRSEYRQYEEVERLSFSEGSTDIDANILLRDVGLVVQEINNSKGVASVGYEAAHLFICCPN
jgi:protein SCO1/2